MKILKTMVVAVAALVGTIEAWGATWSQMTLTCTSQTTVTWSEADASKLFDNSASTKWCNRWDYYGGAGSNWAEFTASAGVPTRLDLVTANDTSSFTARNWTGWTLWGLEGSTWTVIKTWSGQSLSTTAGATSTYYFDNNKAYAKYKIVVNSKNTSGSDSAGGSGWAQQMADLKLYTDTSRTPVTIEVGDWAALAANLAAGNSVTLTNDVSQNSQCTIPSNKWTMTLDLNGHTITRTASYRAFYVGSGNTLTIKNGMFDGNETQPYYGVFGEVYGVVTLEDATVKNWRGGYYGAMYVAGTGAAVTMKGGALKNCKAGNYGGGAYVTTDAKLTLTDGAVIDACSTTNSSSYGGGIYIANGSVILEDGEIRNCSAGMNGGGVCGNGNFIMYGGAVSNNVAMYSHGGGFFLYGNYSIYGGIIRGNRAKSYGGGIYTSDSNGSMSQTIYGGLIENNTAESGKFENIYTYSGKPILKGMVCDCEPTTNNFNNGCSAALSGTTAVKIGDYWVVGANAANAGTNLTGGTYTFCPTNDEYAACGFTIDPEQVSLSSVRSTTWTVAANGVVDCSTWAEIASNLKAGNDVRMTADVDQDSTCQFSVPAGSKRTLDMNGHTISRAATVNVLYPTGSGEFVLKNGICDGKNILSSSRFLFTTINVVLENVTIRNCNNTGGGAAIYSSGGQITMKGGRIEDCKTSHIGGAAYIAGTKASFKMTDGAEIVNCTQSQNGYGGGAVVVNESTFVLDDGMIRDCAATNFGGAVYIMGSNGGTFTMNGGMISNCTARSNGGAVYVTTNRTFTLNGGTIVGCSALSHGGGVYNYGGTVTMNGGEITNCTASSYGGGIDLCGGTATMNDGTISGCSASQGGAVYSTGRSR